MKTKKITTTLFSVLLVIMNVVTLKAQNPGDLDTSFHFQNIFNGGGSSIMELKDKSILIADKNAGNSGVGVGKFKNNGDLDTSFYLNKFGSGVTSIDTISNGNIVVATLKNGLFIINNNGKVIKTLSASYSYVSKIKTCSDGGILFLSDYDRYLRKIKLDGSLDSSFKSFYLKDMKYFFVTKSNKIIVTRDNSQDSCIVRLNSNGIIDYLFDTKNVFDVSSFTTINSIAELSNGKIIMGGNFKINGSLFNSFIICLNIDGTIYNGFLSTINNSVSAISIQNDDKIIVGGSFTLPYNRIVRLNSNGAVDKMFNLTTNTSDYISCFFIQQDGKILININKVSRFYGDVLLKSNLCYVTVDTTSGKSKIIWKKTAGIGIKSYTVYREASAGKYDSIASAPYDSSAYYVDMNSSPENFVQRYRMTATDSSGSISSLSAIKGTIKVRNLSSTSGKIELDWNKPDGIDSINSYTIYEISNGSLKSIATVPVSILQYTVTNPTSPTTQYLVGIDGVDECLNGPHKISALVTILSNKVSGTVGIEETTLQNKFQIYPNPVTNQLNIALRLRSGDNVKHKFEILNVMGQSIYSAMLNEKNVVDMSRFPSGMYVVRIFSDESAPMVKRFVKE